MQKTSAQTNTKKGSSSLQRKLYTDRSVVLPPLDVHESIKLMKTNKIHPKATIIDPWYNKGSGGVRDDYIEYIIGILDEAKDISEHIYLWGFPEIVGKFMDKIPDQLEFGTWITWYYKNNPSVIKGWRSSQQACLHLMKEGANLYPQNFFSEEQKEKYENNKMRFVPGPPSVIEEPLLVGFCGKKEQTGHPAQKPERVYEKIIKMATKENDLVFDPMCGAGTTGAVTQKTNRLCILSDISEEYTKITEERLGRKRFKGKLKCGR